LIAGFYLSLIAAGRAVVEGVALLIDYGNPHVGWYGIALAARP